MKNKKKVNGRKYKKRDKSGKVKKIKAWLKLRKKKKPYTKKKKKG